MKKDFIFEINVHIEDASIHNYRIGRLPLTEFNALETEVAASRRVRTINAHYTDPRVRCETVNCHICHCRVCSTYEPNIHEMKEDLKNSNVHHYSISKVGKWPANILRPLPDRNCCTSWNKLCGKCSFMAQFCK